MQFLFYSHIFISLCALAMTVETYRMFDKQISWVEIPVLTIVFCATFIMYNFKVLRHYIKPVQEAHSIKLKWIDGHRKFIYTSSIICLGCIGIGSFFLEKEQWFLFFLLGVISIWYYVPLLKISLVKIPFLKIFLISIVWNAVTVLVPIVGFDQVPEEFPVYFIYKIIWILALAIIFDIKDKESDRPKGILTLPVVLGIYKTKIISVLILLIGLLFSLLFLPVSFFWIALLSSIMATLFIIRVNDQTKDQYYLFNIDGLVLLQSLLNIAWLLFH